MNLDTSAQNAPIRDTHQQFTQSGKGYMAYPILEDVIYFEHLKCKLTTLSKTNTNYGRCPFSNISNRLTPHSQEDILPIQASTLSSLRTSLSSFIKTRK